MPKFDYKNGHGNKGKKVTDRDLQKILRNFSKNHAALTDVEFDLSDNLIAYPGALALKVFIEKNKGFFKKINMTGNDITFDGYQLLFAVVAEAKIELETDVLLKQCFFTGSHQDPAMDELKLCGVELNNFLNAMPRTVTKLIIEGNPGYGDAIAQSVAAALADEKNALFDVSLRNNDVGEVGFLSLATALKKNKQLCGIDLDFNACEQKSIDAIGEALVENTTLLKLDLLEMNLAESNIGPFAHALKNNHTLRVLSLSSANLKDSHLEQLATALQANIALEYLDLSLNEIANGLEVLVNCLILNARSMLSYLSLKGNGNIAALGVLSLAKLIAHKTCALSILDITQIGWFGQTSSQAFSMAIRTNQSLSEVKGLVLQDDREIIKSRAAHMKVVVNGWSRLAPVLAFVRANQHSPFKDSILVLMPGIMAMIAKTDTENAGEVMTSVAEQPISTSSSSSSSSSPGTKIKPEIAPVLNLSQFMGTLFFNAHMQPANLTEVVVGQEQGHKRKLGLNTI